MPFKSSPGLIFSLITCLCLYSHKATAAMDPCVGEGVVKIERPYNPKDPHSPTFSYSFRISKAAQDSSFPPVIFLPGGPGNTSMGETNREPLFTYIYTDPRGVGCNKNLDPNLFPEDFFSTENLASDVLAIISSQNLSSYILRGQSYGTQLATVIAGRAEKGEAPRPTGIILEGILGHAFQDDNVYAGFKQQWSRIKKETSPEYLKLLVSEVLPFELSQDEWGKTLATLLLTGPKLTSGFPIELKDLFPAMASQVPAYQDAVKQIVHAFNQPSPPMERNLYRSILCKELTSTDNMDLALIRGELVGNRDTHFCDGIKPLTIPFDAKDYQTTSPIYYFQGANDPATPMDQAQYHFNSQTKAPRYFTTFPNAAHLLIRALFSCQSEILKAVANNGTGIEKAITLCQDTPTIKIQNPK